MAVAGFRHLGLKVVSIGLAALIWLAVSGEQIVERALRVPLEFINLPAQLELVSDAPEVVEVRIRGSSGALARISTGELVAVLDLRSARPGQRLFHLTDADVRTPFGIDVVQVSPSNLSMEFELSATKIVPVVPGVEGEPAPGFIVGTISAQPPTVEVIGPASALETMTDAITEPVSIEGAAGPVTETVTVGSPDPAVRLRTSQTARVTVNVTPAPAEWSVAGVPLQVRNASGPAQIEPSEVTVYVRGPVEAKGTGAQEFDASVDVSGLRAGEFDLPVRIVPPAKIGVVRVEPDRVRVRIR